jgi:hypothetical protein
MDDFDEKDIKKKFEKIYPGAKLVPRTKERTRRSAKRLYTAISLIVLFIFGGILTGAPAYAYLICLPIAAVAGYFGLKKSELDKEN